MNRFLLRASLIAFCAVAVGCNSTRTDSDGGGRPDGGDGGNPDGGPLTDGGNPDGGGSSALSPSAARLIFFAVKDTTSAAQTLTLHNGGADPVDVSGLSMTGPAAAEFAIQSPPALPVTVAAGGDLSLDLTFHPSALGPVEAELSIASSDPIAPSQSVRLRGLGAMGLGGSLEPSLQWILDTFEIKVTVGDPDAGDNSFPTTPLTGEEIPAQRFEKAAPGEVSVDVLAVFSSDAKSPVAMVGWYPAGNTQSTEYFIKGIDKAFAQSLQPKIQAGSVLSFDPGTGPFGFDSTWPFFNTQQPPYLVTQEDLNTWDSGPGGTKHHMRVFPFKNPDGSAVANTYVVTTEEAAFGYGPDYNDLVMVVHNVVPAAGGAPTGALQPVNPEGSPASFRFVFNKVQAPHLNPPGEFVRDTATVRLTNTGTSMVTVSALTTSGDFAVVPAPTLPAVLAPTASLDVPVTFTATSGHDVHLGALTVTSDDPLSPSFPVQLAGFWQPLPEFENEPSLPQVIRTFGYTTVIVGSGQRLADNGKIEAVGDEVLSPYWKRADETQPVTFRQIASFHTWGAGQIALLYWYDRANKDNPFHGTIEVLRISDTDSQMFLPRNSLDGGPGGNSFVPAPGAAFGFSVNGGEFSDPTLNNCQVREADGGIELHQCEAGFGHHVRFWPLKNGSGALVPHTYLLAMDTSALTGENYDYNDDVYVISNMDPAPP